MDLVEAKLNKGLQRHPWELARFEIVCQIAQQSLRALNLAGGTLLDVGCGDTWFIENLSAKYPNIRVVAVDILFTDEDLTHFKEKYQGSNISVFRNMEDAQTFMGDKAAGMVLLLDVIEHIEDDIAFMKWLGSFNCIDNNTCFVITVPAYQWLFSAHDVFLHHYRRYTNSLLKKNLSEAGYTKHKIGYFFLSLYLARIAVWCKEKVMGRKTDATGVGAWHGGSVVTKLVKTVLMIDFLIGRFLRIIGINLPGLSNYIICKKSV
jgi:trans-aconitate methyltransferase